VYFQPRLGCRLGGLCQGLVHLPHFLQLCVELVNGFVEGGLEAVSAELVVLDESGDLLELAFLVLYYCYLPLQARDLPT
jgi:hypothetical protein